MNAPESRGHPTNQLDDLVHQRGRLGILSILADSQQADFSYLKRLLQLTDGNLGRHIEILTEQGLVTTTKGYQGKRPRTWVAITEEGRSALANEIAALKQLIEHFERSQHTRQPHHDHR